MYGSRFVLARAGVCARVGVFVAPDQQPTSGDKDDRMLQARHLPSTLPSLTSSVLLILEMLQNGGTPEAPEEMDSERRYIRNARDLARLVATDTIYT